MSTTPVLSSVRKASGWSMVWGLVMVVCGFLAIALPLASSVGIVILLAWLILFAAVAHLIFAFQSHNVGAFLWKILLAILYGLTGFWLLVNPVLGVASLTLVLAAFLLVEGVLEIVLYFKIRKLTHTGWVLFDGIITVLLGLLIWAQWPSSSAWVIGTLLGISLICSGISRFMLALAIRKLM
jgi:uncharacterized membrane protein HdeD (DUF308 family)